MPTMVHRAPMSILAALSLVTIVACSGDESGLPQRYPVSGKVTYKGEPVRIGTVVFEPADIGNGRVASGNIEDGRYQLSTAGSGDGALAGDYNVAIISKKIDMSTVEANRQGGAGRQD